MAAAEAGGGGGPAQAGQPRQPVLEIYTQNGLEPYIMKPVGDGIKMFESGEYKAPDRKYRVNLHSDLIAYGVLYPVLGDSDHEFIKMPRDRTITMPHVNNDNFQFMCVFDNHPMISELQKMYGESLKPEIEDPPAYCQRITKMTFAESIVLKEDGSYWSAPSKRNALSRISISVDRRVKRILKAAEEAAATAVTEARNLTLEDEIGSSALEAGGGGGGATSVVPTSLGGGSRRRRPSRKYKKSKRVLRRKSRSTRRR